jgi:peptidoglycan/xylan/chitin deacetylase (PgdA/CDA1 family)
MTPPNIGPITFKRAIKQAVGWTAALAPLLTSHSARACLLVYHRIASVGFIDPRVDDWNVLPGTFERQIAALASFAELLPLHELPSRLADDRPSARPLVCLTFDDGYANFYTEALPLLKRYHAPATLFVVTSVMGGTEPMPFDRWSQRNRQRAMPDAWQPMSWKQLEACAASGLVTVGAHSHRHLKGRECTRAQFVEEAEQSRAILRARFGEDHARVYSYPYGSSRLGYVPPAYAAAVQASGYKLAVTTDLGLVSSESNWYRLPRVEAHGLDNATTLRAKAFGCLAPLHLTDRLRMRQRAM